MFTRGFLGVLAVYVTALTAFWFYLYLNVGG